MSLVYFGQRYAEDTETVPCEISYRFHTCYHITEFAGDFEGFRIRGVEQPPGVQVLYTRPLPKLLLSELREGGGKGHEWLLGYLSAILPLINSELMRQKYAKGYTLVRPVTCHDVIEMIVKPDSGEPVELNAVLSMPVLLPKGDLNAEKALVYVRDFVDAMAAYLYMNTEDCVRRLITSLENYFISRGFRKTFLVNLKRMMEDCTLDPKYRSVVHDNIRVLYVVRNRILHDQLRGTYNMDWQELAEKGISSVCYAYRNTITDEQVKRYLNMSGFEFTNYRMQFSMFDLDSIKASVPAMSKVSQIEKTESLDDFMFRRLSYSSEMKTTLLGP